MKNTTNVLDFRLKHADNPTVAEDGINKILGGISSTVHGVSELRNGYGIGHGKDADFRKKYETLPSKLSIISLKRWLNFSSASWSGIAFYDAAENALIYKSLNSVGTSLANV